DVTASERMAAALKERNEILEQAEEMRAALIDQISHQMRTPLNAMLGFGRLLAGGRAGALSPEQKDYVECIAAGSGELLIALDAMAELVAIGPAAPQERPVAFDPAASFREAVALALRRLDRPAAGVEIETGASPTMATGHRGRFRQIVFNLALDALSRTPEGGRAMFRLRAEAAELALEVQHDDAPGSSGQALALALARRLARLDRGEVRIVGGAGGRRLATCGIGLGLANTLGDRERAAPLARRASAG
ncbi:MAG: sensor histidine kinase, partial [Pikeienuella sp.]